MPVALREIFVIREGVNTSRTSIIMKRISSMAERLSEEDEGAVRFLLGQISMNPRPGDRHAAAQRLIEILEAVFIRPDPRSLIDDLVAELDREPIPPPRRNPGDMI